jgi:ribosomal protein S18 acetylase RimI-like enzyme
VGIIGSGAVSDAPDPAAAAVMSMRTMELLVRASGQGFVRRVGDAWAVLTEVPVPTLNGVWAIVPETAPEDIDAAAQLMREADVPYCVQARPRCRAAAGAVAERHGLLPEAEIPLMLAASAIGAPVPAELAIRRLSADEFRLHAELCAVGFGVPVDPFAAIVTADALAIPELRAYVGEVAGEPVATAIGVTFGDAVAVFNVATVPAMRRRGHGAALTARAVADGLAAGARWSWLHSTDLGLGVYERLGFRVAERWTCWVP